MVGFVGLTGLGGGIPRAAWKSLRGLWEDPSGGSSKISTVWSLGSCSCFSEKYPGVVGRGVAVMVGAREVDDEMTDAAV